MTYQDYVGKTDNIKTIFVAGIYSALSVDSASDELKLKWIREEYAKLEAELKKVAHKNTAIAFKANCKYSHFKCKFILTIDD